MKNKYIYLLVTATLLLASCTSGVDDLFDKSSSARITETLQNNQVILSSATNGWLMQYYPNADADNSTDHPQYGGFSVLAKFNKDGHVTVASELAGTNSTATSTYKLEQSAGAVLSFDTYNGIFHYFSDPANVDGIGKKGIGMEGDFEFRMVSATADKVIMTGKKHGSRIIMTPLPQDQTWGDYLNKLKLAEKDMRFVSYLYIVNKDTSTVTMTNHNLQITYVDATGTENVKNVPFMPTLTGYSLYDTLSIGGVKVKSLTYDADKYEFVSDAGTNAKLKGVILPVNKSLISGSDWYFCYDNLGSTGKYYWGIGKDNLYNIEGETLGYIVLESKILYFKSGNYGGAYGYTCTLTGDDEITLKLTSYAGNQTQQGNAKYYFKYMNYFLTPLNGTFKLSTDNIRFPTWIKLVDVKDPDNTIIVTTDPQVPYSL